MTICQDRLLQCFQELVAIDAPSFGERAMADDMIRRLRALDVPVTEDRAGDALGGAAGNLIARVPGDLALPPLLFSAHLDTVEPARGKRAVVHQDGRITSQGDTVLGADDVSALAAILEAIATIREKRLRHRPLELVFPVAEEPYTKGSRKLDFSQLQSKEAYVLDLTGPVGSASLQAPTILYFQIQIQGKAAHAGMAAKDGVHAIQIAAKALAQLELGQVDEATTVNIGTIQGGLSTNIVPETCQLEGEVRGFHHRSVLRRLDEITVLFQTTAQELGGRAAVSHEIRTLAYQESEEHPVTRRFLRACGSANLTPSFSKTFGGSDNNTFQEHGIHGIVIASGMFDVHSTREYTTVEALTSAAELTLRLMLDPE